MSVNSFRFVSPGVFINEIDQSQLPRLPEDIGPVVVGRALKGPIMRPVKVQSMSEFEQIFGLPVAGNTNVDAWRQGNKSAPTYGSFAAQAYLKNAGPVTFIRLGGFKNPDADTNNGTPGWNTKGPSAVLSENGGAYGLFIAPVSGTTVTGSAFLSAIIYVDEGSVALSGSLLSGSVNSAGAGVWIKSEESTSKQFKISITGSTGLTEKTFNFDTNSKLFIRNILNTNPTKINEAITVSPESYFLGETFENKIRLLSDNEYAGILIPLGNQSVSAANFKKEAQKASSGWIFGQHKGSPSEWEPDAQTGLYPVQKLFKFHTLSEDEWTQSNVKISIEDIALPSSQFINFGTFSVVLRAMDDSDNKRAVLERFDQCTLDPASPNYIAKKIGDRYSEWDYDNNRFKEFGTYDNKSRYIRVEVDPDVEAGATDQDLLPFGFYGPVTYKDVVVSGSGNTAIPVSGSQSFLSTNTYFQGAYGLSSSSGIVSNSNFTASFKFASIPTVDQNTNYVVTRPESIYWGVKTTVAAGGSFNKEIVDYLRTLPTSADTSDGSLNAYQKFSFVFTLDDISGSFVTGSTTRYGVASWAEGNRKNEESVSSKITGTGSLATLLNSFNKFTLPLVGGFEGLDIREKEPFNNERALVAGSNEGNSYAFNSVRVAIQTAADPETIEMNSLVIPGLKNASLHTQMIAACENRGDSLAIIDLDGDYTPNTENKEPEEDRKPSVTEAVNYVKNTLTTNSSYGCAFFPYVLVRDPNSSNTVWMPPSVLALGTFGSTKRLSEIWFAPAGFTRGGLSELQAGGLPVISVSQKLSSKERDALYEANINPIASFPSEGIVIFGQKTLQATPSALDRINVRRLMNYLKKEISRISATLLFDPNTQVTWDRFLGSVNPLLTDVQSRLGLEEFRVILDETTTTPELVDRNILYAKILLKPTRAIEFIALDFTITSSGASFDD